MDSHFILNWCYVIAMNPGQLFDKSKLYFSHLLNGDNNAEELWSTVNICTIYIDVIYNYINSTYIFTHIM